MGITEYLKESELEGTSEVSVAGESLKSVPAALSGTDFQI
jgi:hypothetical protein